MSSIVGANLVYIRVCVTIFEDGVKDDTNEIVEDHHRDGTPVTIRYLASLGMNNININPDFVPLLHFDYVVGNVVDEPHCICTL